MSKFLLKENPLVIIPEIARRVGLNEAIILQQIQYWNTHNEKTKNNFRDGYYWTFNTYDEWRKQFPFWSVITIKRTFAKLEGYELVISSNYNKLSIDRTKWYRINYEALESLESFPLYQNDTIIVSRWYDQWVKMRRPLPEITTDINAEINEKHNTPKQVSVYALHYLPNKNRQVDEILEYYYEQYLLYKKKVHPKMKEKQLETIYAEISEACSKYSDDTEGWQKSIDTHMKRWHNSKENDLNLNAFATSKNIGILFARLGMGGEYMFG